MAKWVIDADHSVVTVVKFSIWHFMIANLVSYFGRITGMIQFDPPDINHLSIEAEIEVRSITTDHQMQDEYLLGYYSYKFSLIHCPLLASVQTYEAPQSVLPLRQTCCWVY
jgi:hypothetical protein